MAKSQYSAAMCSALCSHFTAGAVVSPTMARQALPSSPSWRREIADPVVSGAVISSTGDLFVPCRRHFHQAQTDLLPLFRSEIPVTPIIGQRHLGERHALIISQSVRINCGNFTCPFRIFRVFRSRGWPNTNTPCAWEHKDETAAPRPGRD